MATYRATPAKFRNGTNHSDEKNALEAVEAKRRITDKKPFIFRDKWREDHPRRRKPQQGNDA